MAAVVPVIVDAAAQLPPRANLTELTAMGADLVVFSGSKGLFGPQSTGLVLGRADLVRACRLNSNPHSGVGRGMKVGKEEICGLLRAVELFLDQDEDAVVSEWGAPLPPDRWSRDRFSGGRTGLPAALHQPVSPGLAPGSSCLPPARPQDRRSSWFGNWKRGNRQYWPVFTGNAVSVGPQTLQDGEAETVAARLRAILSG